MNYQNLQRKAERKCDEEVESLRRIKENVQKWNIEQGGYIFKFFKWIAKFLKQSYWGL